jgi:hypothetical protein
MVDGRKLDKEKNKYSEEKKPVNPSGYGRVSNFQHLYLRVYSNHEAMA